MARHGGWLLLGLLTLAAASCSGSGGAGGDGPIVRLHLSPFEMTATQAQLNVTVQDPQGQERQFPSMFASGALDPLGVTFPVGTRGPTSYEVKLFSDAACQVAKGTSMLTLDSDGVFDLTVPMTAVPFCGNGATLTVDVSDINGGAGMVTSNPAGISCTGKGSSCTMTVMKGVQVTLSASASNGTFAGWSGGNCSGSGSCPLTLNEDTHVQAIFSTCRGWCKEQLPFAVTANLNGIAGTSGGNVLVVGDSGTALLFDGTTWQQLQLPTGLGGVNLRTAAARFGGSSILAAGDNGTILRLNGTSFTPITGALPTVNFYAAAIGFGPTPNTLLVGNYKFGYVVANNATTAMSGNKDLLATTTVPYYAIAQAPSSAKDDVYMGGAPLSGSGLAGQWDGKGTFTQQMAMGTKLTGNIFAVSCGNNTFYMAGDGGAMVSRASGGMANSWTTVNSMAGNTLRGIWSATDNYVFAVGDMGTVVHFDGAAWTKVSISPAIPNTLRAIWGAGPTNIYAVGDAGTVLHYLP